MNLATFKTGFNTLDNLFYVKIGQPTKIFESCCNRERVLNCPSCNFKIYNSTFTAYNEYTPEKATMEFVFYYLGQPIQFSCTTHNIVVKNGHSRTITTSVPFDTILVNLCSSSPELKSKKGYYHLSMAIGAA
ncbi:MAG: hypothetical protein RLZ12_826 [Bacillota bacterium]|jgi:hypothetical protein